MTTGEPQSIRPLDRLAEGDGAAWRQAYDPMRRCGCSHVETRVDPPGRLTVERQRRRIVTRYTDAVLAVAESEKEQ